MLEFLKNHPFAIEAYFEMSLVLTFAVPKEEVEALIPGCLDLDLFEDRWAFIAVAMVETKDLRFKGFPRFLGNDFFLTGFRFFVRYRTKAGKRLRGLYIIKSETDSKKMEFLGNIFTHYNYSTTDIDIRKRASHIEIRSHKSGIDLAIKESTGEPINLPAGSPFKDWKEARKFAGPLPFTFTYLKKNNNVLIIQGVRENWEPQPVEVIKQHFSFIKQLGLNDIRLANAFIIKNIPYHWQRGKLEAWKPGDENSRAF